MRIHCGLGGVQCPCVRTLSKERCSICRIITGWVGNFVGALVGEMVGLVLGNVVGLPLGLVDGDAEGDDVGLIDVDTIATLSAVTVMLTPSASATRVALASARISCAVSAPIISSDDELVLRPAPAPTVFSTVAAVVVRAVVVGHGAEPVCAFRRVRPRGDRGRRRGAERARSIG